MPTLKLAHLRQQGQDMILFPLDASFGRKASDEQNLALAELERRAHAAGLGGLAAVMWRDGNRMRWLGPPHWRSFLSSISIDWVLMNVNKQLSW